MFGKKKDVFDEEESTFQHEYKKERLRQMPALARERARMDVKRYKKPYGSRFKEAIGVVGMNLEKAARSKGDFVGSGFMGQQKSRVEYIRKRVKIMPKSKQKYKY